MTTSTSTTSYWIWTKVQSFSLSRNSPLFILYRKMIISYQTSVSLIWGKSSWSEILHQNVNLISAFTGRWENAVNFFCSPKFASEFSGFFYFILHLVTFSNMLRSQWVRSTSILSSRVVLLPLQSVIHGCCKSFCSNGHLDRSRWSTKYLPPHHCNYHLLGTYVVSCFERTL